MKEDISDDHNSLQKVSAEDNIRVVQLESTHGCKHPCLDSGATPIGSAERAPDKEDATIARKSRFSGKYKDSTEDMFLVPARSFFGQSLGGY